MKQDREQWRDKDGRVIDEKWARKKGRELGAPYPTFLSRVLNQPQPPLPAVDDPDPPACAIQIAQAAQAELSRQESRLCADERDLLSQDAVDRQLLEDERAGKVKAEQPVTRPLGRFEQLMLLVLFVAETCFAALLFEVWQFNVFATWILAASVAALILLAAHYSGASFRRGVGLQWAWLLLGVSLLVVVAIAVSRAWFFDAQSMDLLGLHISGVAASLVFLPVNLLYLSVAMFLGYAHTSAHPEAEENWSRLQAARERHARFPEEYERLGEVARAHAHEVTYQYRQLVCEIHDANINARRGADAASPVWIRNIPDLPIPEKLMGPQGLPEEWDRSLIGVATGA